jgi:hypothetical protein
VVVVGFCVDAGNSGSGGGGDDDDDDDDDDVDVGGSAVGGAMSMAGWFFFCPGFEVGFGGGGDGSDLTGEIPSCCLCFEWE